MNDTLVGVLIGGIIGTIIPSITLFLDHYRLKRSAKLDYLRYERTRLENLFNKSLEELSTGMSEDSYSSSMAIDILLLMPKSVSERFSKYISEKKKTNQNKKVAFMEISLLMKKELANIDDEIEKMFS